MASAAATAACDPRVGSITGESPNCVAEVASMSGSWRAPTTEELSKLPTEVLQDQWHRFNAELAGRGAVPNACYVSCSILPCDPLVNYHADSDPVPAAPLVQSGIYRPRRGAIKKGRHVSFGVVERYSA